MAGVCSVGANAVYVGVIPTPAVAYLTRKYKVDAGVVISASHNPVEFNGITYRLLFMTVLDMIWIMLYTIIIMI